MFHTSCHLSLVVFLLALSCASPASAQMDHAGHDTSMCEACPSSRESSGTAWQPELADPLHHQRRIGSWLMGTHVQLAPAWIDERGPRGDTAIVAPNHGMFSMRRAAAGGTFGVKTMLSLDPLMGARGYPLLGQSGETADGINPLFDRQHPHDFVMELAATYERELASGARASLYVAAVGEPALGPPAFMHRPSARLLPIAPISHHWFDSTHIATGVVTMGLAPTDRARIEGSVFTGREPDQYRWGLERPRFDSYALRFSFNPTPSLALQGSAGVLKEPTIHPGADVSRVSASVMYARRTARVSFDGLVAVAQNTRHAVVTPVEGGFYYLPGARSPAVIAEGTLGIDARHHLIVRAEAARKGELFETADPRHLDQFPIARATIGYVLDVLMLGRARAHVGAALSIVGVADGVREEYGGTQRGYLVFAGIEAH